MKFFLGLLFVFVLTCFANGQNIKLTGTVYDPNGAVIIGASISAKDEKGRSFVGSSNDEGQFAVELVPRLYALEISKPGFLTIKFNEYLIVNSTNGKMTMDFVMFVGMHHEPCGYSGADCLPANLLIKSYKVEYSPKLKKIRDDFAPETKQKKQ